MSEIDEKPQNPAFSEKIFEALMGFYTPADNQSEADEMKSSQDLIEEMEQVQSDISTYWINGLMVSHGFKLSYNGSGYVWLLKIS